jgi:choline dehydrogenase-like flavoprotein
VRCAPDEDTPQTSICVRCGNCDGFPCPLHAKADAEVMGVRPALESPNVTLLTDAPAVRLNTNPEGTVGDRGRDRTRRLDRDRDRRRRRRLVRCGQLGQAAAGVRERQASERPGQRLGSGRRNYMFHYSQAVLALSKEPNPTVFQKTLGVNDFYFGDDDYEYPMGNIQMVGKSQAEMYKGEKPIETKLAPTFALKDIATHAVDFWLSTEDLPLPENRVTLEKDGNVKLAYEPSNEESGKRLYHKLKSMLGHLGCTRTT